MATRARIIALNDHLRTTFKGGQVRVASSIYQLDANLCGRALCVMSRQRKFDESSEHDFGRFTFAGYVFEWCVECLSSDGTGFSGDPADPNKTQRILTLSVVADLLVGRPSNAKHRPSLPSHN